MRASRTPDLEARIRALTPWFHNLVLLRGKAPRIHWYSLLDLPKAWPATTRHREAEGSSYYRHFYMGLIREDGTAKPAARPGREAWFDRQMKALEKFHVTVTFCFTPEDKGLEPHYTSPPRHPEEFADFCGEMTRRYAR
jgi:beta-xylosidase